MQVQTQAAAVSIDVGLLSDGERKLVAQELGYKTIGKELPDTVSLTDVVKSMPPEVRPAGRPGKSMHALEMLACCCLCMAGRMPWYRPHGAVPTHTRRCSSWTTASRGAPC